MIFGKYAQYYDLFYEKKNYKKECNFLEELFKQYISYRPQTILDLGCGTGGHMIPLIKRGYQVEGVETSAVMLTMAKEKCHRLGLKTRFYKSDLRTFCLRKRFDILISMFSVIDYLTDDRELKEVFINIRKHMRKNSLFIFDFWNQNAVEQIYSPKRDKKYFLKGEIIQRFSRTKIFLRKHLCEVSYSCIVKKQGQKLKRFKERHMVRYFSLNEIKDILRESGLEVLGMHPFLSKNGKITTKTWDVTCVCQKA